MNRSPFGDNARSIIYLQAGRNHSAPTIDEAAGLASATDPTAIVDQHRRGVRLTASSRTIDALIAIFEDEGYIVILQPPRNPPDDRPERKTP